MGDTKEEPTEGSGHGVSGSLQKIIGEVEAVGGMLTGDPGAIGEGEFNQEVGEIREELEENGARDPNG